MSRLPRGLYETLVDEGLAERLRASIDGVAARDELRAAEAADRLALHLGRTVERALAAMPDDRRVAEGVRLARRLVEEIAAALAPADRDAFRSARPLDAGEVLRAVARALPDGTAETIAAPLIPLLDTALLTNAPGEPRVGSQLLAEIVSADRIDVVMAFIRRSGIAPLLPALRAHRDAGRELRVLTTTYTGSTEAAALDRLRDLGAEVRVSYETGSTRLHAKAWLFHRHSGFSTAYVGSSNLTHSAQVTGLEWNLRVSGARNGAVVDKVAAVFDSYWHAGDFVPYEPDDFRARVESASRRDDAAFWLPVEIRPEPFQERMLEQLDLARQRGFHRNLLVSATGTGKTVMAALDYARLRASLPRARLLFVAHREEILAQAEATFRLALRDATFGERWVGGDRPRAFEHVFASIQSLFATGTTHLPRDHFDVVIVDEFHHAAGKSYQALLEHITPVELLGMTATPERADGLPILSWFGDRIAAELRLWDAIDRQRLVPFVYYAVHDGSDLRQITWRRGRGYDLDELSNVYTGDDVWARRVIDQVVRRIDDPRRMRALGFCVDVRHARFMARAFGRAGIDAIAVDASTPAEERRQALRDLQSRKVQIVFSVDLFNEGVDVPAVDTLLLLRPTDSPVLFLQQLGRGLRRCEGKSQCTVLDFVGAHRAEYRFDRRYGALLGTTRKQLESQLENGFPFLPAGCHMELDAVARDEVLRSLRRGVPAHFGAKVEELRAHARSQQPVTLASYLDATELALTDVYQGDKGWSDLAAAAGLPVLDPGPHEKPLRRAIARLLHLDDTTRIDAYRDWLARAAPPASASLDERNRRLWRMLLASVAGEVVDKGASLDDASRMVFEHGQVRAELRELLDVLAARTTHVTHSLSTHPDVPLRVHARYTRVEILAAFGVGEGARVMSWQTGVQWVERARADLLAFTLDKTSGQFSPTTRYRDHAISRELIHWESQSATREGGPTGQRYQHHARMGTHVMLFARLRADDRAFHFLGPATYVKHESELPMAITWRLEIPLPADLFVSFAAAVA